MAKLYKYLSPAVVDRVFAEHERITFKCSRPAQFNDPYELFLTSDFTQSPETLAYYVDVIGQIPQLPTTCFSTSADNIPMWAHYAENHTGFVVELDEDRVTASNEQITIDSVEYRDSPRDGLDDLLGRAFELGKPRYIYMLQRSVMSAAYFTKTTCWAYESERRLVAPDGSTRRVGDIELLDLPRSSVTAVIAGARCTSDLKQRLRAVSDAADDLTWLEMKIGRSSPTPYFLDASGRTFATEGGTLQATTSSCDVCHEPVDKTIERCSWCRIQPAHEAEAASRNTYRLLHEHNLLEEYIEGMQKIDRGAK